ncbi:dihydroorotase [Pelagibius marinus]|uniref:dihydroorotase n=1 Tax=Pelagibius marinus TaxID=2762760 RepID=UPI0018731B2E|nr:dihydroorotase [Pelagibius marinus]
MAKDWDLIVTGGDVFTPSGLVSADVAVAEGRIVDIGALDRARADEVFDAKGLTVLPGVIDTQVHFREPGLEHKEDLESGTRAAVMGGVTAVFEMPNTSPATIDEAAINDKLTRAEGRAWCDHAFFAGAAAENAERLGELERLPGVCGVKIFMGSSTGSLLVHEDEDLRRILKHVNRRVAVHSEDEVRLRERFELIREGGKVSQHPEWRDVETAVRSTKRLLKLAREAGKRIHVLHVTTAEEVPILAAAKDIATMEVTPQHLTLAAPYCYEEIGSFAQMNPPIREARHREALWEAVRLGIVDVVGSDHAPHTREEKAAPYPRSPSGMPGVQTLLPLLLDHMNAGKLTLERLVDLTSAGAQRIYNIAGKGRIAVGYDGDFTVVDLKAKTHIEQAWLQSKCGWSPFEGKPITGWPMATIIRGHVAMRDGELRGGPTGRPVRFMETLPHGGGE